MSLTRRAHMLRRAAFESRLFLVICCCCYLLGRGVNRNATLEGAERGCHTRYLDTCLLVIKFPEDGDCLVCWNRDCGCEVALLWVVRVGVAAEL
jgi:hypothetical protein